MPDPSPDLEGPAGDDPYAEISPLHQRPHHALSGEPLEICAWLADSCSFAEGLPYPNSLSDEAVHRDMAGEEVAAALYRRPGAGATE